MRKTVHIFIQITKKIDAGFDYFSRVCAFISGTLLVGVTLIIFAGVINRAFFGWIWLFIEEWSALTLIPISYLVMGYTLRWNRHLRVDLVVRQFSNRRQNALGIFAAIFSLVCLGFMIQASAEWFFYTLSKHVTSSGPMRTPLWVFSGSILFGLVLFAIDMLMLLVNRVLALVYRDAPLKFRDQETLNIP